jgi:transposase-like protein
MDEFITYGVPLIRMATFWTSWSKTKETRKAAKKFFRKLLKGLRYVPRVIITDKLRSYSAAKDAVLPSVEHHQQKYQNNRAENSHQPTRLRERMNRVTRNGFSQPSESLPHTSEWDDTCTELADTGK